MQVRYDYELEGSKVVRMLYRDKHGVTNELIPLYDTSESPIGIIYNGIRYWYVKNLQGDILALRDDEGTDIVRYRYDAWGKVTVYRDRSECSLSLVNPFLYRGYIYDKEYGLYYLQSRYYDPETCRFINPDDPEVIAYNNGDLICNLYTYCLNNPINNTDISGNLTAQLVARIILGIMIGIIVQLVSDIIDIMIARILGADEKRPVGSEYLASALSWALTCVSVNKKSLQIVVALLPIAMKHIGLAITEQFDSRALVVDLIIAGLAIILSTNFDKTLTKKLRKLISKLSSNNTFKGVSKNVIKIALKRRVCGIKFNLSINITYAITSVIVSFLTKLKEKEEN